MSNPLNRVLTNDGLNRLERGASLKDCQEKYLEGSFLFEKKELYLQVSIPEKAKLALKNPVKNASKCDSENAAVLYDALYMITESEASDVRFWAYLAHSPLYDYMKRRWAIPADSDSAEGVISRRWLFMADTRPRALMRQGLSRLWWGAHLTRAPWEIDDFFLPVKKRDPFHYTKLLFEDQDVFEGLLGRSFGRDRRLLICVLEQIYRDKKLRGNRDRFRDFMRKINLTCVHTVLGISDFEDLMTIMKDASAG